MGGAMVFCEKSLFPNSRHKKIVPDYTFAVFGSKKQKKNLPKLAGMSRLPPPQYFPPHCYHSINVFVHDSTRVHLVYNNTTITHVPPFKQGWYSHCVWAAIKYTMTFIATCVSVSCWKKFVCRLNPNKKSLSLEKAIDVLSHKWNGPALNSYQLKSHRPSPSPLGEMVRPSSPTSLKYVVTKVQCKQWFSDGLER